MEGREGRANRNLNQKLSGFVSSVTRGAGKEGNKRMRTKRRRRKGYPGSGLNSSAVSRTSSTKRDGKARRTKNEREQREGQGERKRKKRMDLN